MKYLQWKYPGILPNYFYIYKERDEVCKLSIIQPLCWFALLPTSGGPLITRLGVSELSNGIHYGHT